MNSVPLPHPVRVLVKGSSLVVMTPDWNGEPGEYSFPRWIQNGLLDRGRPCEIDNRGVPGELTRSAFRRWESEVMATSPDAVVYGYAYYECIHGLLPHWLERHVNKYDGRTGPLRTRYRGWLLRPVWKVLAQSQRLLDGYVADRLFRRRTHRIIKNYELLITRTRTLSPGSPLVFVLALFGPGGKAGSWFPGMQSRIDAMNLALAAMVERLADPGVRLVPVHTLAEQLDPGEDPVPDGLHYSPRMRRIIGDWIAAEIDAGAPARRT
ncbi:MAG: SGNH/GDSL hydrolase family protein [Marmoricola sp.]